MYYILSPKANIRNTDWIKRLASYPNVQVIESNSIAVLVDIPIDSGALCLLREDFNVNEEKIYVTTQVEPEQLNKEYLLNKKHPSIEGLLQFFAYAHLPQHLQEISKPFSDLAKIIASGPVNAETTTALRKLLESKDCAVRAVIFKG